MISDRLLINVAKIPRSKAVFDGLSHEVTEDPNMFVQVFKCRLSHLDSFHRFAPQGSSTVGNYRLRANGSLSKYPKLKTNADILVDGVRFRVKEVHQANTTGPDHIVADLIKFSGK